MVKQKTSWGSVANQYSDAFTKAGDSFHEAVILPNLLRIIAPQKGLRVLEVGCGDGFFASAFAERGATVSGSDIAAEMIAEARKRTESVAWHVAPGNNLSFAQDASFDVVLIALALQNMEDLQSTFSEAARVLVPGGSLVLVLNHPAFRIPKRSSWGWDEGAHIQYRRVDGYLSESRETIDMDPGKEEGKRTTISFHRPLQVYVKALAKNGFAITALEEWNSHKESQPGPRADAENIARKEFPLFLMMKAVRIVD